MPRQAGRLSAVLALFLLFAACAVAAPPGETAGADALPLESIRLPDGWTIEVAARVPGARSLARSPGGTIFVGTRGAGRVYALCDEDGDGRYERVRTIAENLRMPNGVAFRDGSLFVAEVHRVIRFDSIESRLLSPPAPVVVRDDFPREEHHGWKFIRFAPDGLLYIPVGAPCNVCDAGDPYAAIHRMRPDGTGLEVFARGIRNSVGFDFRPGPGPVAGELWFTDNGRDRLGDDTPPARALGAHVAALGMRFDGPDRILIAEHGSWNRSTPVGYRVVEIRLEGERTISEQVIADGWLRQGRTWGRPVDIEIMPDGTILVSDDHAGAIYRIRRGPGTGDGAAGAGGPRGERVEFASGGETVTAEIFRPRLAGRLPALIAVHEWWGLNDQVRGEAMRLASEGYVVLAVDLYRGRLSDDAEEAHELMRGLPEDRALRDLRAAYSYLAARPDVAGDSIGAIGWCMGGGQALSLAVAETNLAACVVYYGRLQTDEASLARIRAPVLGLFGAEDRGIPPEAVRAFEEKMRRLGRRAEVVVYPGAGHAFANATRPSHRPEAAADAWARTLRFLDEMR